ncbi:Phospholipase A2-like domain [Popillia japonica]|uniref:Phospholipase A2-like domain n=1 Tax=Popillia japonica TaxID=7064 RepID=A0AAW1HUD5_POPJA
MILQFCTPRKTVSAISRANKKDEDRPASGCSGVSNLNSQSLQSPIIIEEVNEVVQGRLSYRKAALKFNIKTSTLKSRVKKFRDGVNKDKPARTFYSKFTSVQVFSLEEESLLNDYIINCRKLHYGLTTVQIRKLAYEYAKTLKLKYPAKWDENQMVGLEWMRKYRERNSNLSLRKPENTSAAQSFAFNKTAVTAFYNNLAEVWQRHNFTVDRIFNFDESDNGFILVKFEKKTSVVYYVGKVLSHYSPMELKVSYLRKKPGSSWSFVFPDVEDIHTLDISDVAMILPDPQPSMPQLRYHKYLGPGNELSGEEPVDTDDAIALEHDSTYETAVSAKDILKADEHAILDFWDDFSTSGNWHSLVAAAGLTLKHEVEKQVGVIYPDMSSRQRYKPLAFTNRKEEHEEHPRQQRQ